MHAELLLAHILRLPRMQLYLNFQRELAAAEADRLRALVRRRGQREPLQHLVGSTSFCGLEISVDRQVLIPRPETELLAEAGWTFLLTLERAQPAVLDFGTGSGCIAIALAVKCSTATVTAVDCSPAALAMAERNAAKHGLTGRIQFLQAESLSTLSTEATFDLVISNPPYIPSAEIEALEPEVRDYDPRSALDGGPDGLVCYRRLAVEARGRLRSEGRLMLEFGDGQAGAIRSLLEQQNWIVEAVREDYSQRQRLLIARPGW